MAAARLPNPDLAWPIALAGVNLIALAESCRLKAYRCPAGVWTCGWGETDGVTPATRWSQELADSRFRDSLAERAEQVLALCKLHPTDHQLAALVSLSYNIGVGALAKSSVLKAHNRGDFQAAARAFGLWNKARVNGVLQVLAGLTARRAAEAALYLQPDPEEPAQAMPQAVAPESRLAASPIAQGGAATAATGAVALLSTAGSQVAEVKATADAAKALATDTLGIPAGAFLPLVLLAVGGVVLWQRYKQRAQGWA